jgi:UDP-3-O-acyl N-acetylglucosamine deacetylase
MTREPQQTIGGDAELEGRGLFTGAHVRLRLRPAPTDHGLALHRMDLAADQGPQPIAVCGENVVYRQRRTMLRDGEASVETCEHVLSAVAALGIDNLRIEVWGPEMPMADGSALPFVVALQDAGIRQQEGERRPRTRLKPLTVGTDPRIDVEPVEGRSLRVSYDLDYGPGSPIRAQCFSYELDAETFASAVAPARTFVLEEELAALQRQGWCRHLTPAELLVIGPHGPLGGMEYRFPDELARHKVLDIIGDLALLGRPLAGRIRAYRSGHALNHALVREVNGDLGPRPD